jgi:hypothetical protein
MFTLTHPLRQVLATAALCVFCVAPTAYVGWTAWAVRQPGHRLEVEAELGRSLGVHARVARVTYPRPGVVEYRGVVLAAESPSANAARPAELARAELVLARRDGRDLSLTTDGLRLSGGSPRQTMIQVAALLQRAIGGHFDRINLAARTCQLDLGNAAGRFTLNDVAASCQWKDGEPVVTASYRLVDDGRAPRCELVLTRDRQRTSPRTVLSFKTTDGEPISARVLTPYFDSAGWFGLDATIEGELSLQQVGAGDWEADFRGSVLDVDLGTLIRRLSPAQRLTGRGRIVVDRARWGDQPGRGCGWVIARGELVGSRGQIGLDLIRSLQSQLQFKVPAKIDPRYPDWTFESLGLAFELKADGMIRFAGALGEEYAPGAVLVQNERAVPLVCAPDGLGTVAGLVRALIPTSDAKPDLLVPASFESRAIQRYLPLPVARSVSDAR